MNDIYFSERKKEGSNENRRKFLSNRLDFQSINMESGRSIQLDTIPIFRDPSNSASDVSNSRRIEWERIVHYAKRWKRWRFRKRMEQEGRKGDTCGLEVGIARFRNETETGIGGMPLE